MNPPRVLLADDHHLLLDAFRKLLEPECDVVGAVSDGRALLEAAPRLKPDVIVLDISMPLLNGLDAARQIKKRMPHVKLIFLTINEDPDLVAEAFRVGGSGYLLKSSAASELFKAIQEVLRGKAYITPLVTREVITSLIEKPERKIGARDLSARQREVLQLLAEGHSMKEPADILKITPRTIAFHNTACERSGSEQRRARQFAINAGSCRHSTPRTQRCERARVPLLSARFRAIDVGCHPTGRAWPRWSVSPQPFLRRDRPAVHRNRGFRRPAA
jgi:DNA-binding NarL/FixJ family response regulator